MIKMVEVEERKHEETSEIDIGWMTLAVKVAHQGLENGEVPVGAIFVDPKTNAELARSHNLTTKTKNATTHCEVNCIREISAQQKVVEGCTVYVTVEPCIMCAYALNLAKVARVVFGAKNDKFGGNGSILSLNRFPGNVAAYQVEGGVLADEAVKLLQSFYEHGNMKLPEDKRQRRS